jgi:hypothetical protein
MRAACPVLAKADTRPAYRADVSLSRLSPPCRAGVALKAGALVQQQADVLAASARVASRAAIGLELGGDLARVEPTAVVFQNERPEIAEQRHPDLSIGEVRRDPVPV